jgi:hypothetical protein
MNRFVDRLAHQVRARQPDDRLVERDVGVRVLVDVLGRRRRCGTRRTSCAAPRSSASDAFRRGEPRGHALERRPHLDHLDDLLLGLAHDEDAAARHGAQEAFLLEQRHRLADRRARDAERLRELPLVEADLVGVRSRCRRP